MIMLLTTSQKQAVQYNRGPLLIIAGAGTGKTTVIVEKIKYLIKKKLAKPEDILALTFTEKAANEMEVRVDKAVPYGYFQMNISTFHSFCDQILRNDIIHIGLSPSFKLCTQAESIIFLRQNLFLFDLEYFRPLGNPTKFLSGLLLHFSRLRDENITPIQYIDWVKINNQKSKLKKEDDVIENKKNLELAKAYKKYQDLKLKENIFDFADLIYYTNILFTKRPNVLKKYRQQYKYTLIDEFQDTNIAQYELIKLLCPVKKNPKLTVIGDDNQSIYKFRGAAISNILHFMNDYKKAKNIVLTENFRSNQQILDSAYRLIKHNDPDTLEAKLKIPKELKSNISGPTTPAINFKLAKRVEEEADYVLSNIQKLKKNYRYRDFAILVRANNHGDVFAAALSRAGIPIQFLGSGVLFKQPEVKDLIAYLLLLRDLNDSTSAYRVLTMEIFNLDKKDLSGLISFSRHIGRTLFEAIEIYLSFFFKTLETDDYLPYKKNVFLMKKTSRDTLYQIYQLIMYGISNQKKYTAGQILYYFLEQSGLLQKLMKHTTEREERTAINISKFFNVINTYEAEHEDASIYSVADYLTMCLELSDSPTIEAIDNTEYDAVNILTIHSAKGLEFPVVFLVNLTEQRFPTRTRKEQIPIPDELIKEVLPTGDYHLQEERRLFYVGMTRAKDYCIMTASQYYASAKRQQKISPFVWESVGKEQIQPILDKLSEEKKQLSLFDSIKKLGTDFKKQEPVKLSKLTPELTVFSYTQLETYKICPLRYKYQYILKVPIPVNAAATFGQTIHTALQKFYQLYRDSDNVDEDKLLSIYNSVWSPYGFTSRIFENKMKQSGEKMLREFYKNHHSNKINILDLERKFKIKLETNLYLVGKLDRVDKKHKNQIEIIDYKTGKVPTEPELKKDLQMGIYALAAQNPGIYNRALTDITLSFYFLQESKVFTLHKTATELQKVEEDIKKTAADINSSSLQPKVGVWCEFCPFKINCEAWQ